MKVYKKEKQQIIREYLVNKEIKKAKSYYKLPDKMIWCPLAESRGDLNHFSLDHHRCSVCFGKADGGYNCIPNFIQNLTDGEIQIRKPCTAKIYEIKRKRLKR